MLSVPPQRKSRLRICPKTALLCCNCKLPTKFEQPDYNLRDGPAGHSRKYINGWDTGRPHTKDSLRHFAHHSEACTFMSSNMPYNVLAKAVLRMACDVRDGVPPFPNWCRPRGRPPTTWLHQICSDCGLSAGDALNCARDRAVWRTYATASSASR